MGTQLTTHTRVRRYAVAWLLTCSACGEEARVDPRVEVLGRCATYDPLRRPFFGDTHVHTAASLDANLQGTRLRPADAYRFARGEEVGIQPYDTEGNPRRRLRIGRPLDFVALSDHAEFLGTIRTCEDPSMPGYDSETCVQFRGDPNLAFFNLNFHLAAAVDPMYPDICGFQGVDCESATVASWQELQDAAEAAYDRTDACTFTTFVGYEWSASPGTENLHRNVLFRNHEVPRRPVSFFDQSSPDGLWAALRAQCTEADGRCDVLTIPHNSNLSNGLMFAEQQADGSPFDAAYVRARAEMEPLFEILQHKGASECDRAAVSGDEFCDFELIPYNSLSGPVLGMYRDPMSSDFARHALARGLHLERALGTNPFHYGFVGSTDTHIGTPGATSETNFPGHGGAGTNARDLLAPVPDVIEFNGGGLAGVWAEENSREAIFEAMRRRETFATSGPRILVRFFGGYGYPSDLCTASGEAFAQQGYDGGVPMGGSLGAPPTAGAAPRFAISALRDAGDTQDPSVPLQRLQVVKGWVDPLGVPSERVYEVAGDPNNGASVDLATCQTSGTGFDSLCTVWTDPDFDPAVPAYYYVRVLENPSCRWSTRACNTGTFDCNDLANVPAAYASCCDGTVEEAIQERAWSSPIWYQPGG